MPPIFTKSLAETLNRRSPLTVCEAEDGQSLAPGFAYIAPGGKHMKIERAAASLVIRITGDPAEGNCRPSVDYLFRSVAEVCGPRSLGVIMTGMGDDGVRGCRLLKQAGAAILAQDRESCTVFGMPRVVVEEGIADVVGPIERLAVEITARAGERALRPS